MRKVLYLTCFVIESINSARLTFEQCHMALPFPIPRLIYYDILNDTITL